MKNRIMTFIIALLSILLFATTNVYASSPTDEILNYVITVEPLDDASLILEYHIDWKVLSDDIGPLEWLKIGIPNNHNVYCLGKSDTVDSISTMSGSGSYVRVDLDRKYYAGEIVSVDFEINQDYMYQVDKIKEGFTEYSFTPGWFDDINVDNLEIRWKNSEKIDSYNPNCFVDGEYLVWNSSLSRGDKYTVSVTYPNDALNFDLSHEEYSGSNGPESAIEIIATLIGVVIMLATMFTPIIVIIFVVKGIIGYAAGTGFGSSTQKKVTRTKVVYYPSCPGCGAVRKEGEQFCTYCGRSFVKSEEIIKEENIKPEDKGLLSFNNDGEFKYSSSPNTYVRVHTVVVPRPVTHTTSRSSSSFHSSCAHSSCACACACACAGGGRAGCTNKDFYNTDLKLKQLELKLKSRK